MEGGRKSDLDEIVMLGDAPRPVPSVCATSIDQPNTALSLRLQSFLIPFTPILVSTQSFTSLDSHLSSEQPLLLSFRAKFRKNSRLYHMDGVTGYV